MYHSDELKFVLNALIKVASLKPISANKVAMKKQIKLLDSKENSSLWIDTNNHTYDFNDTI